MIGLASLVMCEHGVVSCSHLYHHSAVSLPLQSGAGHSVGIHEVHLQFAKVILPHSHVEIESQEARRWYHSLCLGIVGSIAVSELEPPFLHADGSKYERMDIPSVDGLRVGEIIVSRLQRHGLHRHWHLCHPYILLIHRVCQPHIAVIRQSIAWQYATDVLRTVALIVASIAHWRHLALNKV